MSLKAPDEPRRRRPVNDLPWWVPFATFVVAALAFASPAIMEGGPLAATDILLNEPPYREYLATRTVPTNTLQVDQVEQLPFVLEFWESVRDGSIQWWEPDVGGGMPLLAAVYTRVLTPWFVLLVLVPGALGLTLSLVVGFVMCQMGTYALARRLEFSRTSSTFAAVAYSFSGAVASLTLRINEVLLFPVLMYALHGAITSERNRGRYLVLLAATTAAVLLAGFPAAGVMVLYAAAAWGVFLSFQVSRTGNWLTRLKAALSSGWRSAAAAIGGAFVAALVLIPSYEFLVVSGSLERSFPIWHRAGLPLLASSISGRFFGTYQEKFYWWPDRAYSNPVEASFTLGLVVVALLLVPVVRGRRFPPPKRELDAFWLPVSIIIVVAVFLGGPVLGAIHQLPFMAENSFGRARFIATFGIVLAAGYVLDHLLVERAARHRSSRWFSLQVGVLTGLLLLGLYEALTVAAREQVLDHVRSSLDVPALALLVAVGGVLLARRVGPPLAQVLSLVVIAAVAVELQWGAWEFTPASPPSSFYRDVPAFSAIEEEAGENGQFRFIADEFEALRPNAASLLDLKDARIAFPATERYRDLLLTMDPGIYDTGRLKTYVTSELSPSSSVLDALSVLFFISPLDRVPLEMGEPAPSSALVPISDRSVRIPPPDVDRPIRAVALQLEIASGCQTGWVELQRGGTTVSRRLVRDIGKDDTMFPLPDVVAAGPSWELVADCPLAHAPSVSLWYPTTPDAEFDVVSVDGWVVYQRPHVHPRISLAERVEVIPDARERLGTISGRTPGAPVVVEDPSLASRGAGGTVEVLRESPDEIQVRVLSEGRSLLVVRDVLAPGWEATVNGRKTGMHFADHAFRGVPVPAGESTVILRYQPVPRRAWMLSAGGTGLIILALLLKDRSPRDRRRNGVRLDD